MGQCLSCNDREVPDASEFGLPPNFRVVKALGEGGEGQTFLIREKLSSRRSELFAVKVLPRGSAVDHACLLRTIRNQSCLSHIHIVRLLGLILTPTHLLIKLQYWDGGELYDYLLKQRPTSHTQLLSEEHARFFFLQLVYALHHCHEHRVAHRDMKFANVVLDGRRTPILKVCDFGMSKSWDTAEDCKSFTTLGTPLYMSPEVVKNYVAHKNEAYDPRKSDIWSLGIILFTMLLGRFPFLSSRSGRGVSRGHLSTGSCSDFGALLHTIERAHRSEPERLKAEIWRSPDLSEDCKNLLESMLLLDASKRITLPQIIHHRWVCGPLLLEHAQCIAACREEMEQPHYDPVRLVPGSAKDVELAELIQMSLQPGDPTDQLIQWDPPTPEPTPADGSTRADFSEPSFSTQYGKYRSCVSV